jgi:hypothetical protein
MHHPAPPDEKMDPCSGSGPHHGRGRNHPRTGGIVNEKDFYKTESGTIFRVLKEPEGHLAVELLDAAAWRSAPVGMAGLRLARGTKRLTERQISALPE